MLNKPERRIFEVLAPGGVAPRYISMEVRPGHLPDAIALFEELGWEKEELSDKSWGSCCLMRLHEYHIQLTSPSSGGDPRQYSESIITFAVSNPLRMARALNAWADGKGILCTIESGANEAVIVHFMSTLAFSLEFAPMHERRE